MLVLLPAAVPLEATKLTAAAPRGVSGSAEVPNSLENPPEDIPAPHEECFRSHVLVDTLRLINVPGSHSPSPNDPPNVFGTLPSGVTTFPGPADFHPYQSQQCGILRSLLLSQGQTHCCPTGTVNKFCNAPYATQLLLAAQGCTAQTSFSPTARPALRQFQEHLLHHTALLLLQCMRADSHLSTLS